MFKSKFNKSTELINYWKNGDLEGLREYLEGVNWDRELQDKGAEEAWQHLSAKVNLGITQFVPKVKRRTNGNHQWMTRSVKKLVRRKHRHYNLYMQTGTTYDLDRYKATEKECKKAIRKAKKKFESSIARNGNKRPFNSYIRSKTKSRVRLAP